MHSMHSCSFVIYSLGYIDLSRRQVDATQKARAFDRLDKSKKVHAILQSVHNQSQIPLDDLYEMIAYPLAKEYGHSYEAFKKQLQFFVSLQSNIFNTFLSVARTSLPHLISRKMSMTPS